MSGVGQDDIDVVMEQVAGEFLEIQFWEQLFAWEHVTSTDLFSCYEDDLAKTRNTTVLNWEGEAGGRGIRALTRYIYQAPAPDSLTDLNNIYDKMTGFFMVTIFV